MKRLLVLLAIFLSQYQAYAQTFSQAKVPEDYYKKEWLYGLHFSTNGGFIGGFMFKYSWAKSPRWYHSIPVEIANIKHPKELKVYPLSGTNSYVQGKSNYLFVIRPQYGRDFVLFRKAAEQGVQVNAYLGAGPSLGVLAPYLIRYDGVVVQFDPKKHNIDPSLITGAFDFSKSISKASFHPGASLKASLLFEMGASKRSLGGFEAGFTLDAFPKRMILVPEAQNRWAYPAAFITIFYGIRD